MKVKIIGPRHHFSHEEGFSWLQLTVDLEELPKVGEHITLNGGSGFVVESVMWWVTGPENDAYFNYGPNKVDYREAGEFEIVHVNVRPDSGIGSGPRLTRYEDGAKDGTEKGAHETRAELVRIMSYTNSMTDINELRSVIFEFAAGERK